MWAIQIVVVLLTYVMYYEKLSFSWKFLNLFLPFDKIRWHWLIEHIFPELG